MRNVRFWIHCPGNVDGGFVKLTLRPSQSLSWYSRYRTTEGWSSTTCTWTYDEDDGIVTQDYGTDGCDCDGRLSSGSRFVCPVGQLSDEEPNDYCRENYNCADVTLPAWVKENAWQHDHQAEAAGY